MIGMLILIGFLYTIIESVYFFPDLIKRFLLRLLRRSAKQLAVLDNWLDRRNIENPLKFDDLTPIEDADQTEVYEKALSWALKNEKIKNIAITGPYGSGKSSLIKTFEKKHPGYRYLNISLASFQEEQVVDGKPRKLTPAELQEQHRLVELSILQQMFYRVRTNRVPDSRFNRIKHLSSLRVFLMSVITILGLISFLILVKPSFLKQFSWFAELDKKYTDYILYAAIIMSLPLLYKILAYILRLLNTSKFNKINLSDGEIEFDAKSETSVLNKHLDEILYFFEVTHYNVVVFEDLDRFNDPEIFTKLREISILVNKALQIGRHIAFVYAVKDEMFRDKSRTKFFDFLVPVIPVITAANSYELLKTKFNQEGLELGVTDKFISAITLYVDDMRTLKNIYNEFMVYAENLKSITPNPDKLLALIVFKNACPHDFAELHEEKGIVVDAFEAKLSLIQNRLQALDQEIVENNQRMETLRTRERLDAKELRAAYVMQIQALMDKPSSVYIKDTNRGFNEVYENEDYFNWLRQQTDITYQAYHPNYGRIAGFPLDFSFDKIEKAVYPNMSYDDRRKIVSGDAVKEIDDLLSLNNKLSEEKRELETHSLQQLIAGQQDELTGLPADFIKNKLLVYLVRNGYIDEAYRSLMSNFYEGSLSSRDMAFILSIRDKNPRPFEYQLDMFENLVKRLEVEDFRQDSIYNLQLGVYLSAQRKHFPEKYRSFVGKLQDGSELTLKFLGQLRLHKRAGYFFNVLFDHWTGFGDFILNNAAIAKDQKLEYFKFIIDHGTAEQWQALDTNDSLSNFAKTMPRILQAFAEGELTVKFKVFIKDRDLSFHELESPSEVPLLFDFLIDEERYHLNAGMIRDILIYKGTTESQAADLQDTANYTAIQAGAFQPLIDMVDERLQEYVTDVVLGRPANSKEQELHLLALLNKDSLSEDSKAALIQQQEVQLGALSKAPQGLWNNLLTYRKITETWANALSYYTAIGLSEYLIAYLNYEPVYQSLAKVRATADKSLPEAQVSKLWGAIIKSNALTDIAYTALLTNCPWFYKELTIEGLSPDKIKSLINTRTVRLNAITFTNVSTTTPDLRGLLIERNFTDYQSAPADYPLETPDLAYLLRSGLNREDKNKMLCVVTDEQLQADEDLTGAFRNEALNFSQPFTPTSETVKIIFDQAADTDKNRVLRRFGHLLNAVQIKHGINQLPEFSALLSADGKEHVMAADAEHTDMLKLMKKNGLIADYQKKKNELLVKTKQLPREDS